MFFNYAVYDNALSRNLAPNLGKKIEILSAFIETFSLFGFCLCTKRRLGQGEDVVLRSVRPAPKRGCNGLRLMCVADAHIPNGCYLPPAP